MIGINCKGIHMYFLSDHSYLMNINISHKCIGRNLIDNEFNNKLDNKNMFCYIKNATNISRSIDYTTLNKDENSF